MEYSVSCFDVIRQFGHLLKSGYPRDPGRRQTGVTDPDKPQALTSHFWLRLRPLGLLSLWTLHNDLTHSCGLNYPLYLCCCLTSLYL